MSLGDTDEGEYVDARHRRRREHLAGFPGQRRKGKRGPPAFTLEPGFSFSYRDPAMLRQFVSEQGKIVPRRISGLTCKQQRELTRAIKRARVLALLPSSGR